MRRPFVTLAALTAVSCGMGLPLEERIASTRPLALRVEVAEPNADPVRAEALPFETVRIVPLIVDPEGLVTLDDVSAQMEPVWLGCALQPIEGLFSCLSNQLPVDPASVTACPALDPTMIDPTAGEFPELPRPCLLEGGTPAQPEFVVPLDFNFLLGGDLEVTMVAHLPDRGDTQTCLEQLLTQSQELSGDCLYATQRVAVGPDAALLQLAADVGLPDVEQFGVIPDQIPDPDTHPRIDGITVREVDENDVEVAASTPMRGQVLTARAGHRFELETTAPESDLQTYLIPRDMTAFDERTESYAGSWFITWGSLLSPTSDDPLSINTWTLSRGEQDDDDLPPANRATLFYVLRDDRQGVDWWWFHVDITEE